MYSYDTGASVIPKYIWIGFIAFASDINSMNELEIISIKNKYEEAVGGTSVGDCGDCGDCST